MADYQNAGPPPCGVNFQPPVPDTTFGPIPHVYVPRFDAQYAAPSVQVGSPSLPFFYVPAEYSPCPPSFTVIVPQTYYVEGHNYYASCLCKMKGNVQSVCDEVWYRSEMSIQVKACRGASSSEDAILKKCHLSETKSCTECYILILARIHAD